MNGEIRQRNEAHPTFEDLMRLGKGDFDLLFAVPSHSFPHNFAGCYVCSDPEMLWNVVHIVGFHFEAGIRAYADGSLPEWNYEYWTAECFKEFGTEHRACLRGLWDECWGWFQLNMDE